jgi:uncharacterized protein YggE
MTTSEVTKGTLELYGTGAVDAVPDMASLRLTIVTERKTAGEAVADNAKDASAVVQKVLGLGIPREDVQTEGLNLFPVYQTDPSTNVTSLVAYRVTNTLHITAPVDLAGEVFDVGVAAGADESSGLSFGMRDPRPLREKALELAVSAARKEAELVCRAMGVTLLGPKSIQVQGGGAPLRLESARLFDKAQTPVMPGSLSISATVQIVFEYSV